MISVVIPTFNRVDTVPRAIESALNSLLVSQVIVVDDGSTDGTDNMIKDSFSGVKYIRQCSKGANNARNTGLSHVLNDFVLFLDSDDEITHIPKILSADVNIFGFSKNYKPYRPFIGADGSFLKSILEVRLGITSSIIFRTSAIRSILWDEYRYGSQEYDLLFRMLIRDFSFKIYEESIANVYVSNNSISTQKNSEPLKERLSHLLEMRSNCIQRDLEDIWNKEIYILARRMSNISIQDSLLVFNELISDKYIEIHFKRKINSWSFTIIEIFLGFELTIRLQHKLKYVLRNFRKPISGDNQFIYR